MNRAVRSLECQFESSTRMLRQLVELCPEPVWTAQYQGAPFWQRVYHVVFYIDYWLRPVYDRGFLQRDFAPALPLNPSISPALATPPPEGTGITRAQMLQYLSLLEAKAGSWFTALSDDRLGQPVRLEDCSHTYTDVILGQVRHIMYNVGHLNGALEAAGCAPSAWYAYNEPQGS